ncbi:MAG: hypothetical protein K8F30_06405 [Taibaiella sp.]|nr:hypothetical protein [Taibaiella sp.]
MKVLTFLFIVVLPYTSFCQDISGKWAGNYGKSILSSDINTLVVDIELYNDSLVRGASHLFYGRDKYEHYIINGVYRKEDSTIYFSEDEEIDVNLGMLATTVMGNYTMKLKVNDTAMRFEGKWRQNGNGLMNMMATKVWLEKKIKPQTPPSNTAQLSGTPTTPASERQTVKQDDRKDENEIVIQREIEIDTIEQDSIRIDVIDNARIDNDVISIYVGDKLIVHKHTISREPSTFYISLGPDDTMRTIRIVAESYGTMPPCTAHMKVTTCKSIYTFDVQSTYRTDAAVEFHLKGSWNPNPALR